MLPYLALKLSIESHYSVLQLPVAEKLRQNSNKAAVSIENCRNSEYAYLNGIEIIS